MKGMIWLIVSVLCFLVVVTVAIVVTVLVVRARQHATSTILPDTTPSTTPAPTTPTPTTAATAATTPFATTPPPTTPQVTAAPNCQDLKQKYGVVPGSSWGTLNDTTLRSWWSAHGCDALFPPATTVAPAGGKRFKFGAYVVSWDSYGIDSVPDSVDVVLYCFLDPYGGGLDTNVVRSQTATLKARRPDVKVLVSVGGGAAGAWGGYDANAVANFVRTCGLDGADIDYEDPDSWGTSQRVADMHLQITRDFRAAMPRPLILSTAIWASGIQTGNAIPSLQSELLDDIFVMSYDSNITNGWYPYAANLAEFARYTSASKLWIGIESPPEGWGAHVTSLDESRSAAKAVKDIGAAGVFIWNFKKRDGLPNADQLTDAVVAELAK